VASLWCKSVIHLLEAKKLGPGGNGCGLFALLQENNLDGIQLLIRHFSSGSIFHLVHHLLIPAGDRSLPSLTPAQHKQLAVPFFQGFLRALQDFGAHTDGMPSQLEIDTSENILMLLLEVISLPRAATSGEKKQITHRDSVGQRYNLTMLDETGGRTGRRLQDWLMAEVLSTRLSRGTVPCLQALLQRTMGLLQRFLDVQKAVVEAERKVSATAVDTSAAGAEVLCTPIKGDVSAVGAGAKDGDNGSGSGSGSERESEDSGGGSKDSENGRKKSKWWKPVDRRIGGGDAPMLTGLSLPARIVGALARLCANNLAAELEAEAAEAGGNSYDNRPMPPPPPSSPPPPSPPPGMKMDASMYPEVGAILGFKFKSKLAPLSPVVTERKSAGGSVVMNGSEAESSEGVLQRMCNALVQSLQIEVSEIVQLLPMPKDVKVATGVVDAGSGGYNYSAAAAAAAVVAAATAGDEGTEGEDADVGCLSGLQKIEIVRLAHALIVLNFGKAGKLRHRPSSLHSNGSGSTVGESSNEGPNLGQVLADAGLVPRLLRVSAAHPRSSQVHNAVALVLLELIEGVGNRNVVVPRALAPTQPTTLAVAAAAAAAEVEAEAEGEGSRTEVGEEDVSAETTGEAGGAVSDGGAGGGDDAAEDPESPVAIALRTVPLQHSLLTGGLLKWLIEGCTRGVTKSNNFCEHRCATPTMSTLLLFAHPLLPFFRALLALLPFALLYKSDTHFSHTSHTLLTHFSHTSHTLLTHFSHTHTSHTHFSHTRSSSRSHAVVVAQSLAKVAEDTSKDTPKSKTFSLGRRPSLAR
jgi:hypothetical protein